MQHPVATCPAHEAIIDAWSKGAEGRHDPLPIECALRLAVLTEGQPYVVLGGEHEFGPGEGINSDGSVEDAEMLQSVDTSNVRDSYRICRKGRVLCVVFIQYDPTGHACGTRIDVAPAGSEV